MTLNTRKPTGLVAYPLLLLEGEEKAGKTYAALSLSRSEKIGRTFILELDEPTADEYQSLGDFEIIEHNGTYTSILDQLTEATKVPMEGNKPNVIILDTGSAMWGLLKDWASSRARNSRKGRQLLEQDPDAEIDISMNLWNDSKDRWYAILNLLRKWPGIGIITARGKEVAKVQNGVPVVGQSEWSTEAEKSTPYTVSAVVRMTRPHVATLTSCRSLNIDVGGRGRKLASNNPIEELVFDVLGAGGDFQVSSAVPTSVGRPVAKAKNDLIAIFARGGRDEQAARQLALEVWTEGKLDGVQEINDEQWVALSAAASNKITTLLQQGSEPAKPSTEDAAA